MDGFISVLIKYPNGTNFVFDWGDTLKVKAELDSIYETDNGLELDEEGYEEFFACTIKILSIEKNRLNSLIKEHKLLEVSRKNNPSKIFLESGELMWENN